MSTQRWTAVTVALAGLVFAVLIVLAGLPQPGAPTAVMTASPVPTVLGATATPVQPVHEVEHLATTPPTPASLPVPTARSAARLMLK